MTRRLLVVVALAGLTAAGALAAGSPVAGENGVGGLKLGMQLRAAAPYALVGKLRKTCDLAVPAHYDATLRAPLRGAATFSGNKPTSPLIGLSIVGGAKTAQGIGVGSTDAAVRRAYPKAKRQVSDGPLIFKALSVARAGKDRMWFMLNRFGGRVTSIEIPAPDFCE